MNTMKITSLTALQSLGMLAIHAPYAHNVLSFTPAAPKRCPSSQQHAPLRMTIVSPFDNAEESDGAGTATYTPLGSEDEPLDLTWENVDLVLEEMRPYLLQDGGNVAISEIDGPIVRLELQGACGTCPSSTQTMKMGLERKLKERIPEIQEVIQAMPDSPDLNEEQINVVLDTVRPFLQVAGGTIDVDSIKGEGGMQPTVTLKMQGSAASLNSVKLEIAQRLQRHFMISGLRVEWAK